MSSSTWNPASLSSFIFDRNRYRRSASEQTHTVTTHEYHSYRRRESPCPYQSHCEYCPCINCRLYRQPSYRHHMSRRQTSSFTPDGRKEFYSSAHSIRDEMRKGSPTGIGIALNSFRQFSPQTEYQQRQQQRRRQQQQQQQQQQQHQQAYQPHHFHDYNEYERQRQERLLQINRRSTREVQPGDQAVPSATSTSRYDEAVIKRRLFLNDLTNAIEHEPKELASVFLRRRDQFLNLYSQYMYDRSRSEHVLQTNPNIQRYFDELTQRLGLSSDLTLNNLLNRPIQRLEKYKNILQEMVKYTNRMREDSTIFQQAYTMISNVINDARQRDATELIDNIPFTNEQLGDLKRHDVVLIKTADHDLDSVNEIGTRLRERFLYLYRHKIVLCRRKRADSRLESRSLAFKQAYNTNEITFIQENFPDDDKKFEITFNDNERVTFHARNAFSKMSLVRALRDNLKSLGFVEEIEMVETTETEDDTRQKRSTVKKRTMDVLESTILEQQKRGRSSGQTTSGTSDFYSVGSETESSYQTAGETEDFKPKFLKKLNDTLATEGDFVTLECIVVSTTPVHATWFKNNIPLQDNADCRLIQEDKRFQIHIKEAFVEDGGVYSIKISNHAGTVICSCKLFVREETSDERTIRDDLVIREGSSPEAKKDTTDNEEELRITEMTYDQTGAYKLTPHIGRAPIFLQSLMPIISKAGDIVTLKCTVTATPMPSAIWYKNGQEIQPGGRYSVFQDQNGTYSLVISDALPQDSGSYEITVRNQYGTANSKTNLQILERESVFIPIPATRVSTEEHGTAKLSCAVKRPDVYVDWYKGEQALFSEKQEENHKYKRVDDGLQRELIVKNVSTDDQGDYVCQADKYRVTLHLNVQGPAAEFVRPLENIEVTENNEAVFECQLSKEDAQVEWWFRGIPIVTSQHHLIASRGYIRQLIIPKVAMNDEGEYSIRVDNKNTSTAQLFVKEQPIIFRRPLRSQIIEESSSTVSNNAVFECELNKPLKQMLWFKSNVQHLAPSDKYQIESFANGLIHRLTIRNVNLRDDGEYTASTGLNTSQARLTIESLLPVFIVPLMDARANTRETVKLSCETSNSCQVIWTHRGKKIIENSYKYTIGNFNNSTLHTLDIDDLDLRDQGEVLCSIAQHPSVATTCKLLVEDAQQQSAFFTPLKPFMEVGRGQDAILECETYESTYFQWFKDGTTLTQTSNKYRTVGDEKHSTLIVKQFTEYDEGVYTCVTREGKSTSTTIRTVIHRERTPRSEERFGSYMKIDSPRASQTPELGGYRSSVSPTAPRYIPSLGDDDRRRSPRFEETRRTKKITIHETSEQRVSSGPRPGTTKSRPSASPSPQREYIRSGYSSGTSPERERISMPRHFSPSTTYKSSSQLQEFSHYIDRSSQSPSPSPTRKTSITLTNVTPSAKMPPVYEEQDEHQRHRTSVTFSPSRSPARQPSTRTSVERKVVEMQIPMSPTMPRHELKHAPYREESIPEERIQFLDSETYDKQTPIFHREEPYGLSTSRVQITETLAMVQITQPLVDTRVEQGKPLRLVVETSQPSSEATWFKTDIYSTAPNQAKKLDENGKYHMITQGTRHILIVPNATSDDNGEYICRIQNAMTRAQVQVTNEDLQFIRRLPPSIDVIGGRDIIIECEMNKMDTQAIWKKDNELIRAPQKFIPVSENKKHKLIIKDASSEDSGLYTVIVNDLESTTYVNVTPEPLLILKPLQDQRVHSGDTVTFTCVCSKAPKTVQWYLNGYPLPINERYQTKLIDREIQLTINNVQESDIGTITCCLNNTITTANLTLDDKDKTLKFIKLLEDDDTGHIQVDSPFMLECRTNRPTYQIRWFKDNREISQYDQVMRTISDGCTHVLQISRAQPDHTGRYRCVVTDSLETSCHITVREPEYRFTQSLPSNIQFSPQTDRSLTLDGTLNRKPTQIQWFKNSIEIFPSRKHEIVNEHHVVALIIHDLSPDDQGLYRCVIANGQAVNECQVSMNLMTESDRRLIKPLQDQNIYVHDTCTLHVQFQGDAPDVKWYKNGQEIYPNQKYRLVRHGNEQTLIIDDCQLTQDQAYYSLRLATNPKVDLTSCYVQVKDKYVTITKHLEPQRCILGQKQQVQFDCETTPTDKKPVWLFNNQPIDNSSKYELVSTDNTHHLLFIHQPELSDQGQYTISFPESNQSSTANLQVLQTPSTLEFIQPLDEVFLCEEGDNFVLVTRTNKPTQVSWMKNGYKLSTKTKLDSLPTNEHRLTIDKAQKIDHEGIYTCIIDANNIATQCHVKILERELQLIQPLPKQIRLNEHDTLTLICETNRKPKKVQWFKDQSNIPLETNNSLMIINADETCTLIINNANKFDSGTYTCRLEDRLITVSDVKIHESAVQFVDGPQSYLVWRRREDGPVVNISCTLNKPNVPVKWFRENQEIRPELNNKYEVISEGTIQCLLIHDAQKEDSTKYVISLGTTYRACHLDVVDDTGLSTDDESFDRVVQPLFPLQRQEVMEGDSLTIEVSPDSDLRLTSPNQFRLLKNNQPVVDDSHIQLERDTSSIDSNRWVIRLVDVDLKDSGVYSIELNNQIRQDLLDLSVKKRPIQRQFITLPKDEFYLHETITLECKFERPIKTKNLLPTWFKNGRPIQPSNHYLINVESSIKDGPTKYSITIKNVDFSDEGIYELRSDYLIVETPFVRIIERPTQPAPLRTVTEGDSLQIDVNIDQKDYQQISPDDLLNQITVLKDNRPIINKPEINKWFDGKEFNLELKNLSLNDRGLYEIDIQGQRTSICLLDVKERQPDVFLLDLDRNTFEEGETIRLACTFPQRPGPIANWFKDGHLIHPNENIQLIDENNTLTIVIRNAKRTDSGVYEVRIGPVIARAPMIYVIPKREQPDIPVQNVREGDTVTLSVEGLQTNVRPQDIQLLKNGKPIIPSQKPKTSIKREDDKLRIILQTLGLDDSALYSVQIQNDIHPLAQIVVEPRQPEIQQMQLEQDTFYIGDTVTLDLEFTNEPTEQPRWTKDNILLRNNERVSIETIGNRVTLIVRDLRLDDAGVYEVQSGPLIVRTPFINVVERPHDVTEIVDETITYTITPNRPLPPVETKVCTIKEGDDVTLKISSPTPITINDVHLYKNGQPIPIDNETRKHIRLEQFGNKDVRLTITNARLIDAGDYSAVINDNMQSIIKLDVQPRELQIQMINLPQDTFKENETLKIDCRFPQSNINTDYKWYKDNQPIIPNDRIVMKKDTNSDSLTILNLQISDAGVYELRNPNNILRTPPIKVISTEKKINIEELRPQVSSKLVHEGDTVTFELTPNFDVPLNKIELFHEESPITHEPHVHMKKDYKTNSITVQIEDIKIPDHGLYTAIVQGQSVPLAELIVEPRPTIIQNMDLPKEVFYTGERLELECEFPQVPKGDQPKWFKNNQLLQPTPNIHLLTENNGRKHSLIIDHLKPEDTGQYELRVKGLIVRTPLIRVIQREQPQIDQQPSPYIVTEVEDDQDKYKLKPEQPQRRISQVVIEDITSQQNIPSSPISRENIQRVQEGDSIQLKVVSTLDVKPNQIRLIHDGVPIDTKKRSSIIVHRVSPGNYTVSLLNLRVSDSGKYEYQVEGAPTPKHLVTLYVEPRAIKEKTLDIPQTTFNVGESILFKVDFDEKDQITEIPKWYKNEMFIPIDTSPRHKLTIDRITRTHTFEIYNLQVEDSGVYEMRTPNLTVKTPEIKVIPKPGPKPTEEEIRPAQEVIRKSSVTIDMKKPKEQLVETQPVEEFQPVDENIPVHEVTEGDMMHLTVEKPSNVHLSDIKLFKNNQPLIPSKNIHTETTSPTTIDIKFSPVELIDNGFYSIKIRDQIQPIMQLNVRQKPIQRQIMNLPQDTFIENETLTIECKFDSKPNTEFIWTKDGSILYNDSRIIIKQKNETFTLIIKDLKLSDQGVYSLESKYLILDTPFIHILPKQQPQQQPTVQIQRDETTVTMQPSVTVADKVEEIKIKEQPLEQVPAPTAVIESKAKKPDETITTTTTIEQQQQEPSVIVSAPVVKPEPTKEEIIVQTQQPVPVEQVVEVKTTTVEETQPQPKLTVTEQQEQIIEQPIVTPVERPKPSVETQPEQPVTTTTQVEEQPLPQLTTDISSTKPKTEEQPISTTKTIVIDERKTSTIEKPVEQTIPTTDITTSQEQISPVVTTEQETIPTEKQIETTVSIEQKQPEIPIDTVRKLEEQQEIITTTEQIIETPLDKKPELEKPTVEQTIIKEEETKIITDTTPRIEELTEEHKLIIEQPKVSEETVTVIEEIRQKEEAPAVEQPKQEIPKLSETLPEVSTTTVQKKIKTVEEQQLPSIEQPTVEQTIITDEVTTTETIPIVKETPTTIEEVIQKDVSPVIEEIQKPTEKRPIIEEVIEENPKPATTVTEEVTTIEEIIQETKVPVEEQPEQPIQPTSTTEEVIEEALKVPTTIVEEKSETKPTEQITTIVKEETITEKEKPITDERIEEKPTVQEIVTTEEVTITETIPTIKETPTTTEEVATTKEFIEEKPKTPTTNIEETIITEEVIQEEKVPVKEQPKYPTETASTTEEVIEETSEVPITVVEEKSETKPTEQITTVVEEETIKEKEKPITDERIEEKLRVEKIISDIPTKTVEEQLISPEKPAIEETITTEEVTITETIPTIKETPTTTEEVIQKDISPIIEKTEKPTEKIPIVEEVTTTEKVIEEKPKPTTTVVEEVTTTEEVIQAMKVPIEEQPKYSTETIPTTEKVIEEAPKVPIAIVEEKPKTKSTEQIKTIVEEEAIKEKPLIDQPTEEKSTIEKIVFDVPATTVVETITKEEVTTTETIPTVKESLTTTEDIEEGPIVEEAITIEEFVKEKPKTQTATIEETIITEEVIQEKKVPVEEQPKYSIETISTTEEVIEEAPKVPTTVVEEKPEMKPIEEVTTTFQEETVVEEEKPTQTQPIEEVTKAEESIPKAQTTTIEEEIKTIEEPFVSIEKPVVEQPVTEEEEIPITETISTVTETVIITETPSKETVPDQEQSKLTTEVIEEYKTPITEQPTITAITEETTTITEQVIPEDTVPSVVETPKTIEKIPTAEEKPTELISTVEEVTQEKPSVDEQIKPIIEIVSTIEDIIPTEKIEEQPVPKEETPKAPTTVTEELVEKKIELKPIEEITTITEEKLTSEQEKPTITQQVEKTSEVEVPTTTVSEQITTTKEELTTLEKPTVEDVVQKDIVPSAEEVVKIPEVPAPVAEDVAAEKSAMKPDIIQTVEESKTEQILSETSIKPSEVPHETKETITTTEQVYEEKKVHFQEQPKETIETIEDKTITATEQPKSTTSIIEDETTTQTLAPEETVSEQEQIITPLVQDTIVEQQPVVTETVTTEEIFPTSVQVKQEETISTVVDTTKPTETVIEEKPIAPTPIIEEVPTTEKIIQETKASVEEQPRYPTETISTTEEVPKVPTSEVEEKQETKPTESIPTVIEEETEKPLIYQPSEEKPTVDKLVSDIVTTTIAEGIKTVEEQNLILTEKPTVEEIITKEEITTTETIPTDKETSITTEETIQKDVSPVIDETQKLTEKVIEEKPKPTTAVIEEVTTTEETIQETKVPVEEQPKKPIETTSTIEEVIEKASTVPTTITEEKPETKPTEQKTTVVEEEKEKPLIDERTEEKPTVEGIISDIPTTTIEETVITKEVIQEEKVPVEEQPKHPTDQTLLVEERIEKKPLEEVIKTVQDEDIIEQQKPTITKTTEETFVTEMIVPVVPTMVPEEEIKTVEEQLTSIEKPTVEQTITTEEVTTTETIPTVKEIQEDMSPRIDETPKPTEKIPISEEEAKIKETIKEQQAATMTIEEVIEKQPEFKPTKEETTTYQQETIITEEKPVADQSIENIIVETPTVTTEEKTITVEKELVSDQKPSFEQIVTEEEKSIVTTELTQPAELPVQRIEENTNLTITVETPISKNLVLLKDGVPLPVSEHVIITPISPTTTTIEILKAKPEDEGEYTIIVNEQEQPLVKLEVTPKPVTRQEMQIPKTQFNEKETLTIVCQFDATPEEPFVFLHNDQRIVPDSRVTTTVEDNKYTIVVKDLRPEEDEGVYTLKSDHLILDTPSITVLPKEKKPQTETTTVEEEQVIVTTVPEEQKKPKLQEEQIPKTQLPVHEVEETTTVTLTVEQPQTTKPEEVVLLKDGEELKPSDHVKITPTSPTTTEIQITKVKPEDEGDYTVKVKDVEQPLVRLKVH
ncbi:unnamed protein product, partial [Rotaria sordida]